MSIELQMEDDYRALPIFDGRVLQMTWPLFRARLSDKPIGDFAYLTAGTLACRNEAWSRIEKAVGRDVEVLPIEIEAVPFVVLNVKNVTACLDHQRSKIRYFPGSDRVYRVLEHVFYPEMLSSSALFVTESTTQQDTRSGHRQTPRVRV